MLRTHPYLQLQGQRQALSATAEAPGSPSHRVQGRHFVLGAQARPGHQGPPAEQHVIATSTGKIIIIMMMSHKCKC